MKILLAILALLAACPAWASDPSAPCFNNLDANAGLAPLRPVIALGNIKGQTMEMMTSARYPAPPEKELIKLWVRERDQCFVLGENWRLENMPAVMRSILDHYYAKNKLLIADLYVAKITYGEFATRRASLSSDLNEELNRAWQANQSKGRAESPSQAYKERERAADSAAMLEMATRIFNPDPPQISAVPAQAANCASDRGAANASVQCR